MKTSFFSVMAVILLSALVVVPAGATEVVLRDGVLVAEGLNEEHGLGAFSIVLVYGSDVSFEMEEWVQPYSGAINVQNRDGITRIGGLTTSTEAQIGDVSLIRLKVNGSGTATIYVDEFCNAMGDPIEIVNRPYRVDTPGPAPSEVTQAPVVTAIVTQSPVQTAQQGSAQPAGQTGPHPSGTAEQEETPTLGGAPVQTPTGQSVDTVATQDLEASPARTTEPVKSPQGFAFVIFSLLVSIILFQIIYKKKE